MATIKRKIEDALEDPDDNQDFATAQENYNKKRNMIALAKVAPSYQNSVDMDPKCDIIQSQSQLTTSKGLFKQKATKPRLKQEAKKTAANQQLTVTSTSTATTTGAILGSIDPGGSSFKSKFSLSTIELTGQSWVNSFQITIFVHHLSSRYREFAGLRGSVPTSSSQVRFRMGYST